MVEFIMIQHLLIFILPVSPKPQKESILLPPLID